MFIHFICIWSAVPLRTSALKPVLAMPASRQNRNSLPPSSPLTPRLDESRALDLRFDAAGPFTDAARLVLETLTSKSPFRSRNRQEFSASETNEKCARQPPRGLLQERRRITVVNWILELSSSLAENPSVPSLALSYFDAYIALQPPRSAAHYVQLVAAASFLIACKMNETFAPTIDELAYLTDGACSKDVIVGCELLICVSLNFDLCARNPHDIIPHLCMIATGTVADREVTLPPMDIDALPSHSFEIAKPHSPSLQAECKTGLIHGNMDVSAVNEDLCDTDDDGDGATITSDGNSTPDISDSFQNPPSPRINSSAERREQSSTDFENANWSPGDESQTMTRFAMAFADVALHCCKLVEVFGVGEIAAACVVAAQAALQAKDYRRQPWFQAASRAKHIDCLWLPIFDSAGLAFERIIAAATRIIDLWSDLRARREIYEISEHDGELAADTFRSIRKTVWMNRTWDCRKLVRSIGFQLSLSCRKLLNEIYSWSDDQEPTLVIEKSLRWEAPDFQHTYVLRKHNLLKSVSPTAVLQAVSRGVSLHYKMKQSKRTIQNGLGRNIPIENCQFATPCRIGETLLNYDENSPPRSQLDRASVNCANKRTVAPAHSIDLKPATGTSFLSIKSTICKNEKVSCVTTWGSSTHSSKRPCRAVPDVDIPSSCKRMTRSQTRNMRRKSKSMRERPR